MGPPVRPVERALPGAAGPVNSQAPPATLSRTQSSGVFVYRVSIWGYNPQLQKPDNKSQALTFFFFSPGVTLSNGQNQLTEKKKKERKKCDGLWIIDFSLSTERPLQSVFPFRVQIGWQHSCLLPSRLRASRRSQAEAGTCQMDACFMSLQRFSLSQRSSSLSTVRAKQKIR